MLQYMWMESISFKLKMASEHTIEEYIGGPSPFCALVLTSTSIAGFIRFRKSLSRPGPYLRSPKSGSNTGGFIKVLSYVVLKQLS